MQRQLWGAHPFVWAAVCVFVAVSAILLSVSVLADPHRTERRAFLRQCHEQAFDRGIADQCADLARTRFGAFNSAQQTIAYIVAALAVFAGTFSILLYVVRQVGIAVSQRS